jgi:type I restriction enzyme S subunit
MSLIKRSNLPEGWVVVSLSEVAEINPKIDKSKIADNTIVSFVPMQAVGAGDGGIDTSIKKHFADVKKGYTPFQPSDVLFAKITPCMENGKIAVVPALHNNVGFGSTEFHVIRPKEGIDPHYICYYISRLDYRKEAASKMTGAVGQKRVPTDFIKSSTIPLAPLDQQKLIVAEIEKQFSRLDEAVTALKRIQANLKRYKASVLKAAFEGKLTEEWRKEHPDVEPASELLKRILAERKKKWEAEHPGKKYKEPASPDTSNLPELPKGWVWVTVEQVCSKIVDCPHSTPKFKTTGNPCIDTTNIKPGQVVIDAMRYVDNETFTLRNRRLIPQKGDVVFAREGTVGTAVSLPESIKPCLGQRVMMMRPCKGLSSRYLQWALNSEVIRQQYLSKILGTTAPHVNVGDVVQLSMPLPLIEEQEAIVNEIDRCFSLTEGMEVATETNIKRADHLRQSILKKAFSGRLCGMQ